VAAEGQLGKLGTAFVLLSLDASQLPKEFAEAKKELEKDLKEWGGRLKSLGTGLTIGLTAPIIAMGAAALHAGQTIDDAFDTIRINTGKTGKELAGLQNSFENVFKTVPDNAQTVADALSAIHQRTGLTGKGLEDLTKQELDLARITKTDLNANIDGSIRLFNAWQIETDKQSEALDFLFRVHQSTGIGVTDLMSKVVDFMPILKQYGLSFEESATLMGQWSKAGLNSEQILGALRIAAKKFAEANIPLREGLIQTVKEIHDLGPGAEATKLSLQIFGR